MIRLPILSTGVLVEEGEAFIGEGVELYLSSERQLYIWERGSMGTSTKKPLQSLTASDLLPIVQQILGSSIEEIPDWQMCKMGGGAGEQVGFTLGLYRVTGTARSERQEVPWSAVLKMAGPSSQAEFNEPSSPEYWKREVFAYQSGVLNKLPGGVVAPHCYGVDEVADGTYHIWLEDIQEIAGAWTMEDHHLAARHLGQFNGAYLVDHPLPEPSPWMLPGRMHFWVESNPPDEELLLRYSAGEWGRWLPKENIERMRHLWAQRTQLFDLLDRLPACFCHHDAFRRNLMFRKKGDGRLETVAIDWQTLGQGKVGQEIAITTAVNLFFVEVPAARAKELDDAVFTGYCAGLREAGWQGDSQLARFGYAVTAALTFGVAFTLMVARDQDQDGPTLSEAVIGLPISEILDQWEAMHPFLLDLGDEALKLMPALC